MAPSNLQIPAGEPPVMGRTWSSSMVSWRCSLPAVLLSPHRALISSRTRSAPLTLFQLERCRNGVKCCSAQCGGQGTQPVPICALLDTLLPCTLPLVSQHHRGWVLCQTRTVGAPTPDTHPGKAEPLTANPRCRFAPCLQGLAPARQTGSPPGSPAGSRRPQPCPGARGGAWGN